MRYLWNITGVAGNHAHGIGAYLCVLTWDIGASSLAQNIRVMTWEEGNSSQAKFVVVSTR